MNNGQTIGVRVFTELAAVRAHSGAKVFRSWADERFTKEGAEKLQADIKQHDLLTAKADADHLPLGVVAAHYQELADVFAFRRDHQYGHRSRKWLYARATESKITQLFQAWTSVVQQNLTTNLAKTTKTPIVELLKEPIKNLMARD